MIIPVAAVLAIGIAAGVIYWLHARHFESTDDAYIDGQRHGRQWVALANWARWQ